MDMQGKSRDTNVRVVIKTLQKEMVGRIGNMVIKRGAW
ncbi:hypothetical protein Bandiella_01250 [Candidatus Bandiella woodruffii]|uniref:Uncharacterized protein n=1 Tax=Candidatus Bandiella euplotis TaxID=1664265 RepID=A0ABZ0ULV4_9RICK|nr:hypothetical protein Bandiella_01250 [Candidatus Bandiella woodruffii]